MKPKTPETELDTTDASELDQVAIARSREAKKQAVDQNGLPLSEEKTADVTEVLRERFADVGVDMR